jgi:putative ABC transport system permease protein
VIRKNPAVVSLGVSVIPEALPLAYCLLLALTVALLCGIAPAWTANQVSLMAGVRDLRAGRHGRRFSMQRALVSAQVAICFILLSVAAVLGLTFFRLRTSDPGFDVTQTIAVEVRLPRPAGNDFFALRDVVSAVSGVQVVSCDQGLAPPIAFFEHIRNADSGGEVLANVARVGPRYFETMGIRIERGRDLKESDFAAGAESASVVVNQTFARRYFAAADPIDQRLVLPGNSETGRSSRTVQIVGIARDNKATTPNGDRIPVLYSPQLSTSLLVRVAGPPSGFLRNLERVINMEKAEAMVTVTPIADRLASALFPIRVGSLLIGVLSAAALLLAMTGLYGVVSYAAKRRSFEIGVRIALGATRLMVTRLILHESLVMVGLGCAAGTIGTLVAVRAIRTILAIEQTPLDMVAVASVFLLLLATGVAASLSPVRRATTIDPIVTLRHE